MLTNRAFAIGQRVKVSILNRNRCAVGCAEKLDGHTGVIEQCKENSTNSITCNGPAYLIRFDVPAEPWWGNSSPHTAFWFDPCDLV
jgi:hypothetical protein